jgi:hypothetical protein
MYVVCVGPVRSARGAFQGALAGYYLGPLLYSSQAPQPSTSTALSAEVGSLAHQRTVLTKLHRFGRLGFVPRPVLMACAFSVVGMMVAPLMGTGEDVLHVFRQAAAPGVASGGAAPAPPVPVQPPAPVVGSAPGR